MERHAEHLGDCSRLLLRGKDPSGPISLEVDEEEVVCVEPTALDDRLYVGPVSDERSQLFGSPDRHDWSLRVGLSPLQTNSVKGRGQKNQADLPWAVM